MATQQHSKHSAQVNYPMVPQTYESQELEQFRINREIRVRSLHAKSHREVRCILYQGMLKSLNVGDPNPRRRIRREIKDRTSLISPSDKLRLLCAEFGRAAVRKEVDKLVRERRKAIRELENIHALASSKSLW